MDPYKSPYGVEILGTGYSYGDGGGSVDLPYSRSAEALFDRC